MSALSMTPQDADIPYEEALLQNPYSVKNWLAYLEFKSNDPPLTRNLIYERALRELPGSYKIWVRYLKERREQLKGKKPGDPAFEAVNRTYERCLVFLHRMPRIWMDFTDFLATQRKVTKTRHMYDQALRSLAFGQHERIWKLYLNFVRSTDVPAQTACRVFRRYLKYEPTQLEEYIEYLIAAGEWDEAAKQLVTLFNTEDFRSKKGKSRHDYWMQLCDIISKHSDKIKSVKVETILRGGLTRFSDQVGSLWTALADYYIRMGHFEKARDLFEEGMDSVITVKDFTQIWDAYAKFEDELLAAQMETMESGAGDNEDEVMDFDLRAARYENLIERQPLLINSVLLRQNPHNVHEWQKRAALYREKKDDVMVVETYELALQTVEPPKAKGKPHNLWVGYAKYYESKGDLNRARDIFERGAQTPLKSAEDLASIWAEYAEMEIRQNNYQKARLILQRATTPYRPTLGGDSSNEGALRRVFRSTRLWAFYADLEENLGTFASTQTIYEKMFELKVMTPQIIINYARFLEENKYYEESFKAYEKGIAAFGFPFVFDIWIAYLHKFVSRYGGRKLERARELFEQVLDTVPANDAKIFFVLYAELEERYGLARHAMSIYDRATRSVADKDKFAIFSLYINRAAEYFGVTRTREIYEKAIESLPAGQAKDMSLRFAELEKKLGEIDRARGIYVYGSQFCDPRIDPSFWNKWREFEVEFGNEDTFREMLQIKRSVQAQFNTQLNLTNLEALAAAKSGEMARLDAANEMQRLEREEGPQSAKSILVAAKAAAAESSKAAASAAANVNPEKIELDEDEGEEEGDEDTMEIQEISMPQAVIDRNLRTEGDKGESMGALARLKRKQADQ
eukprot:TRINITY_DN5355_c0_g1_i2.p1 TRINITY_DN5355_c0_g1~~TRINITY_DN5355_c0_g1_i2.p1  ORF type:complete len:856 (+),score=276.49 TRINITY_DN5355_c0_g1_i2:217-2784(+)